MNKYSLATRAPRYSHNLREIYSLKDGLKRDAIARKIAQEIRGGRTAQVIGVYGRWGSGKSYLLSQTISRLLEGNAREKLQIIACTYSPWQYEMEGDLAPGLIEALSKVEQEFPSSMSPHNPPLCVQGEESEGYKQIARSMLDLVLSVAPVLTPSSALASAVGLAAKTVVKSVDDYHQELLARRQRPSIEALGKKMQELVDAILDAAYEADTEKTYRLVIFIDDLDRCCPENMVRMFEWLKVHLLAEGCVYVLALDHVAAARAIVGRYKEYLGEGRDLDYGFRYLEKLVDSEYELGMAPRAEQMALEQVYSGRRYEHLSEAARQLCGGDFPGIRNMDDLLALRSLRNPRTMLKIANKFGRALETILSDAAAELRTQLPSSYPFWILLLTAMYYKLEPDEMAEFVRGRGEIYELLRNPTAVDSSHWGDGPLREFCQYASHFGSVAGTSMQLPSPAMMHQLAAIVRENVFVRED